MILIVNILENGKIAREIEVESQSLNHFVAEHYCGSLWTSAREQAMNVADHYMTVRGLTTLENHVIVSPVEDKRVEVLLHD